MKDIGYLILDPQGKPVRGSTNCILIFTTKDGAEAARDSIQVSGYTVEPVIRGLVPRKKKA